MSVLRDYFALYSTNACWYLGQFVDNEFALSPANICLVDWFQRHAEGAKQLTEGDSDFVKRPTRFPVLLEQQH